MCKSAYLGDKSVILRQTIRNLENCVTRQKLWTSLLSCTCTQRTWAHQKLMQEACGMVSLRSVAAMVFAIWFISYSSRLLCSSGHSTGVCKDFGTMGIEFFSLFLFLKKLYQLFCFLSLHVICNLKFFLICYIMAEFNTKFS